MLPVKPSKPANSMFGKNSQRKTIDRNQAIGQAIDSTIVNFAGGGYIFVHRMLLEHFAEMSIEQGKR